jgi:hypothetical protein
LPARSIAASTGDLMAPIRRFLGAVNRADTKTQYAACARDDVVILDEFAPHVWVGPRRPQQWAADQDKQATGVTDGRVTYGAPSRKPIEGDKADVIVPTV